LSHTSIQELVIFEHKVFQNASVHTGLLFIRKELPEQNHKVKIKRYALTFTMEELNRPTKVHILQSKWHDSPGFEFEVRQIGESGKIVSQIIEKCPPLETVARASLGCQAYNSSKHTPEQIKNRVFHSPTKLSDEYLSELAGNDVGRYFIEKKKGQWIKYGPWLHDYRTMDWLIGPRILIREISGKPPYSICACYVEETFCNYKTILNVNPSTVTDFSMKYLLGLLNSRLMSFLYPHVSNKMVAETFPRLSVRDVKRLPIRPINFSNPTEKAQHDRMVSLVERMLELHANAYGIGAGKQSPRTPQEKEMLAREIESTDAEIDRLVYELYGLTEEEIKVVEEG